MNSPITIWNFEHFKGAEIDFINKKNLRKATSEEEEEYLTKFNNYITDWEANKK